MLTIEENELLTRVGPATPCGELLRRYWHPIATLAELSDTSPTRFVRVLGEDLVLFRCADGTTEGDRGQGTGVRSRGTTDNPAPWPLASDPRSQAPVRVGLLADHCPHRGASLVYGRVEERGIACAYHGWLYDVEGNCLETPAEPADSKLYLTVKHRAYPVQERYGLYWTYMGPEPVPVLPRFDVAEVAPIQPAGRGALFDCNWLQVMENHMDQAHVFILHQDTAQRGVDGLSTARGQVDMLAGLDYWEVPFGIRRRQVHESGYDDSDLMIFPNAVRIYNMLLVNVPIDDTHSKRYSLRANLSGGVLSDSLDGNPANRQLSEASRSPSKTPPDGIHPFATYQMEGMGTQAQDLMALETQGPIAARHDEHLATSDKGVVLFRSVLKREIEKVQQGLEPIAIIRDPDQPPIDTNVQNWIEMIRRYPPQPGRAS